MLLLLPWYAHGLTGSSVPPRQSSSHVHTPACLEKLEPRTLFFIVTPLPIPLPPEKAWVSETGTLYVLAGAGDHTINVSLRENPNGAVIVLAYYEGSRSFAAAPVQRMYIDGGLGNDRLYMHGSVNVPATIVGGEGNDTLFGSQLDEWLIGEAGNDYIAAGDGDDVVHAGAGDDTVAGNWGNDTILGLRGNDVLSGDMGQDHLDGGPGADNLTGGDSNDFLEGGADNDILDGGAGTDTLYAGDGNDYLIGGRGVGDSMRGGMGNDRFRADDILGNADSMWGEAGFDVLVSAADADDLFVRGPQTR
jgi:Ca2+-binding RTX toxin-like protein